MSGLWSSFGVGRAHLAAYVGARPQRFWPLLILLCFLYLAPVTFHGVPGYTTRWVGAAGWLLMPWLVSGIRWPSHVRKVGFVYFALIAYLVLLQVVIGSQDYRVLKDILLIAVQLFPGAVLIAFLISALKTDYGVVLEVLFWGMVFYATTIVMAALSPEMREWFSAVTLNTSNIVDSHQRARGLLNASGAGASALIALGFLAGCFGKTEDASFRERLVRSIGLFILFAACYVAGRTGLILIALSAIGFVAASIISGRPGVFKTAVVSTLGFGIMAFLLNRIGLIDLSRLNDFLLLFSGQLDSGIWKAFSSFVFWPESFITMAFGNPSTYELNRIPSDLGYVRLVWAMGLLGSLLFYVLIVMMLFFSFMSTSVSRYKVFLGILCAWLFLIHFKEPFLLDQRFLAITILGYIVLSASPFRSEQQVSANREVSY